MLPDVDYKAQEQFVEAFGLFLESVSVDSPFLYKSLRQTVVRNPGAIHVHVNYVRYQGARHLTGSELKEIDSVLNWLVQNWEHPGFDWNNVLKYLYVI